MPLPKTVKLVEVGPRDGLQNEKKSLSLETKLTFIKKLSESGLSYIEAGSFVSPDKVPQMENTQEIIINLPHSSAITYGVLVPNERGLINAIAAGCKEISIFTGTTDSFCQKNINCDIEKSFLNYEVVCQKAIELGIRIRGYLSCCFACPYEGKVAPEVVSNLVKRLLDMGCYEVSLGDTIGVATPEEVRKLLRILSKRISLDSIAVHFHDTYGQAIGNIYASLLEGISVIDSSTAGLGGCPYANGASGNVATEDVLYLLQGLNIKTGVDLEKIIKAGNYIIKQLDRENGSKVALAYQKNR